MRTWLSIVQSRRGKIPPTRCSTLTGSVSSVQPNRRTSRPKCVSTVIPGTPNALPSTTFAVLRPTPGSVTRSARRPGTSPSNRSTSAPPSLISASDLFRKKPVDCGVGSGVGVPREDVRGHHVHPLVGRLGREDRRDQQLEGVREVELAVGVGVPLV